MHQDHDGGPVDGPARRLVSGLASLTCVTTDSALRSVASRAAIRSYGALTETATREWLVSGSLTRPEVGRLLTDTLIAMVHEVREAGPPR
jgi:hypothetical protein